MNNAEKSLTENATTEINSMRSDLEKLINEFDLLKIKMREENSDEKITEENIEAIIRLIDDFITDYSTNGFRDETFSGREIDDVSLSVNYSCEVELDGATIEVDSYFVHNFNFYYDEFCNWIKNTKGEEENELLKFIPFELFELITEIVDKSVRDIDTSITFRKFENFECEMDSYRTIQVTEVTIRYDEFIDHFESNFDFDSNDIENTIKEFYNFKEEESDEDNSDENNSEEE
jgi:hypothetical protein